MITRPPRPPSFAISMTDPSTLQHTPDVSIVLPVHNEQGHLLQEIMRIRESMDASSYTYEIIVVDDGSTDGSGDILERLRDITLIRFRSNHGSGYARRYGTLAAKGRIVVWTDVDMTYPNHLIPRLLDNLDGYDQIVGARSSERGSVRFLRVPAKWFIRKLASILSKADIPDLNSGFRAFRRDVALQYLHLIPDGFSCVSTMTLAFLNNGYSVTYMPISYSQRAGKSKFHWLRDTRLYLLQVIRMTMLFNPLRVYMPVASILGMIGVGKLLYDVATKNFRVATNTIVILLAALAVTTVALLADLIVMTNKKSNQAMPQTASDPDATRSHTSIFETSHDDHQETQR